jgi:hypothetical protein
MGTAAILGIISALLSWITTFAGHPFWGIALGLLGAGLGAVGLVIAASPRVRGGILSISAIVIGGLGALVGVLGVIGLLF